jgi:hypothetical protein
MSLEAGAMATTAHLPYQEAGAAQAEQVECLAVSHVSSEVATTEDGGSNLGEHREIHTGDLFGL